LPAVVQRFRNQYPDVSLQIHQGSPAQIAELLASGEADFAIAPESSELFDDLIMLPCYYWHRSIIVPLDHPLTQLKQLTIHELGQYPLVTYVFGFTGHSRMDEAFQAANLDPNVVFTASDTDVIKTYVRLGLGVGIIARMAYDETYDHDLICLDATHLFIPSMTKVGFRRGTQLRRYMYDFINFFSPHLTPDVVRQAERLVAQGIDLVAFFEDLELSVY
jgi:LysR family cys regulon transcriptional activator